MMRTTCILAMLVYCTSATFLPRFRDVSQPRGIEQSLEKGRPRQDKYFGATVADFDRDGSYDFVLSNHGNNPELYYMTRRSYVYRNMKLNRRDIHATATADMDNDGYLDIIINRGGSNGNSVKNKPYILRTGVEQNFTKTGVADLMGIGGVPFRGRAMSFADLNNDGHLDLILINARNKTSTSAHIIYENLGNGKFEARNHTGIEEVNTRWFHVIDVNSDSYPDLLFMKHDGVELWLGTGDFAFTDATSMIPNARGRKMAYARAIAEIDYDNDGDLDLVIVRGTTTQKLDNVLLERTEEGYNYIPLSLGVQKETMHSHVTTGDFNNDGFMDMYISQHNGFKRERDQDLLLLNQGDKTFAIAPEHGTESEDMITDGDNAIAFDFDNDGRLDILQGQRNSPWRLLRNVSPKNQENNYLIVRIGTPRAEMQEPEWFRRKALGALVKVFCDDKVFMQRVGSPGQSHSQSYMDTLHFGVGSCKVVDSIEVHYWGNVVMKRTSRVRVNRIVNVGNYFNCPEGFHGQKCKKRIKQCTLDPCPKGTVCETVELVRDQCTKQCMEFTDPEEPMETPEAEEPMETELAEEPVETELAEEPMETPEAMLDEDYGQQVDDACMSGCLKMYCPV